MAAVRRWQAFLVCFLAMSLFVPASTAPATALSPPTCNEATGLAATDDGAWVLTSWDRIELRDSDWGERNTRSSPGSNNTYSVARGPNSSLWLLQSGSVVNVTDRLRVRERIGINAGREGAMLPDGNDLTYTGRWLVLFDGDLTSYNESWGDPDPNPPVEDVLPEDTRGLSVTGDTYVFLTTDRTLEIYERVSNDTRSAEQDPTDTVGGTADAQSPGDPAAQTANVSFEHRETISLHVSRDVVDVHPGPDGSLLILHPGNVTAVTSDGERIDHRASVFSPGGCDVDTSDAGEAVAYLALLLVGLALVGTTAIVVVTAIAVTYLRG